jgi:hypothetical protein
VECHVVVFQPTSSKAFLVNSNWSDHTRRLELATLLRITVHDGTRVYVKRVGIWSYIGSVSWLFLSNSCIVLPLTARKEREREREFESLGESTQLNHAIDFSGLYLPPSALPVSYPLLLLLSIHLLRTCFIIWHKHTPVSQFRMDLYSLTSNKLPHEEDLVWLHLYKLPRMQCNNL